MVKSELRKKLNLLAVDLDLCYELIVTERMRVQIKSLELYRKNKIMTKRRRKTTECQLSLLWTLITWSEDTVCDFFAAHTHTHTDIKKYNSTFYPTDHTDLHLLTMSAFTLTAI